MKTLAIIASLTVIGSIAYAAGSQGTAGKQPPVMPSGTQAHSMQEEMPQARMQQSPGCPATEGSPLSWFGQARDLPWCTDFLFNGSNNSPFIADVNGDGVQDFFTMGPVESFQIRANGVDAPANAVLFWKLTFNPLDASEQVQKFPVLTTGNLAAWLAPEAGGWTDISAQWLAWFDADSDGDLDFGFEMVLSTPTSSVSKKVWCENIGYQKPAPPIAADINRDGRVDGADLGLVLVSWGPNP
jgi:hypothetical protein